MRRLIVIAAAAVSLLTAGRPAAAHATPPAQGTALAAASPSPAPARAPAPAAAPLTLAATPQPLTLEALRKSVSVRQPRISPDGTRVVYVRGVGDYKADVENTELVLVDAAGGARRVLTQDREDVSSPTWSPDGTRIAFLAAPGKDQPPEIYVLALDGGDAKRITRAAGAITDLAWRPDGHALAYVLRDPPPSANKPSPSPSPSPQAGASPAPAPATPPAATPKPTPSPSPTPKGYAEAFTVTDEHYLTRAASRPSHVWLVDADGANPHQLTHGTTSDVSLGWVRDGTTLAVVRHPDAVFAHFTKAQTFLVDAANGSARPLRAGTIDDGGVVSPDGTRIAVVAPRHNSLYLHKDVAVRRLSDGADVATSVALDRNVAWHDWLDDRNVLVGAPDGVRTYLWRVPLDGGAAARYDLGDVDFGQDATVAKDGTIAFLGRLQDRPGEIYVMRRNAKPVAVTDENAWTRAYTIARSERVDWTSDGMAVNGVLTYPANYAAGKQYPLVLVIHGGPVASSTRTFSALSQMLAAHGFLVLQPNYRGSDNSGDAFLQA
ncbi:MAG: hypothetical protein M3N95_06625, partial [Actinomycetota bacterium]|nr:hypothetical protein [Actinomycetota bacterium]